MKEKRDYKIKNRSIIGKLQEKGKGYEIETCIETGDNASDVCINGDKYH